MNCELETDRIIEAIKKEWLTVAVKRDEPLRNHTTFKVGGAVRLMCFPENVKCAARLFELLCENGEVPYILGNGSNILADDKDHDIAVINTSKLRNIALTDTVITADSGVLLSEIAFFAYKHGLTGLEFAHGIPGSLGGAIVMNAGAYDGEMKDVVRATNIYNTTAGVTTIRDEEHAFSYRNSIFTNNNDIILSSELRLKKGDADVIKQKMDEFANRRATSQPLDKPSAGSIFKRPKDNYAAVLIEQAGLKGFATGGAQVSEKHAGFVINTGNATFCDIMAVIEYVQETVEKQCGVKLEMEVSIWK